MVVKRTGSKERRPTTRRAAASRKTSTSSSRGAKKSAWEDYKGKVTQDALKRKEEQFRKGDVRRGYIVDDVEMYIPREGANVIRIVPPLEVSELAYYGLDVHFHRNVGLNNDYFLCLKRMYGKPCYVCEQQTSQLWEEDRDLAKSYFPDHRVLMWVLDLGSDDSEKLLLWSCPRTLAEEILGQSHKKSADVYLDISDPFDGRKVFFDRIGQGRQTKYKNVQIDEEPFPLDEGLVEQLRSFSEILIVPTYEEVRDAMEGMSLEGEEEGIEEHGLGAAEEGEEEEIDLDAMDREGLEALFFELGGSADQDELEEMGDDDLRQLILELDSSQEQEEESEEQQDQEQEQEEEEPPECFGVEFDKYQDCDTCDYAPDCREEYERRQSQRKKKPARAKRASAPAAAAEGKGQQKASSSVRQRLEKAIRSRKRSAGGSK